MTFLAIISLQFQNLANFAQLTKLRATYSASNDRVGLICAKRHLLLSVFPLSAPLESSTNIYRTCFLMPKMFFISRPPYCIWGDKGAKSEKNRDKMHFPEHQPLFLLSKESKTRKF